MTPDERQALGDVLEALHDARVTHGMPVAKLGPGGVNKTNVGPHRSAPGFLSRYRELVDTDGPEDARALLVALVRLKVREQAQRKGGEPMDIAARAGKYANSVSLTRDSYWPGNLDAARAELHRDVKPANTWPDEVDGQALDKYELAAWKETSERFSGYNDRLTRCDDAVRRMRR